MQKITPFLWFDMETEEAMNFYTSVFKNSRIVSIRRYPDEVLNEHMEGMQGKVLTGVFELNGYQLMALDGGPIFKFNPSISFFVTCETEEEINELWEKLSDGGQVRMEFQKYPFAEKFGWVSDKYGVDWQLTLNHKKQSISPALLFTKDNYGKAEEAIRFYTSLFPDSSITTMQKRGPEHPEPEKEDTVEYASFKLNGQDFNAMESNLDHPFTFNEAVSLYVNCETQEEVDKLWGSLSAVPESEQCGWLKDKYGVSWQIVPQILTDLISDPDQEKANRVMSAMLKMKKIVITDLEKAAAGE
jgi:predicted 3-demethylubiquinone-9 3-methyltransferase (glyoxalase superfamily)